MSIELHDAHVWAYYRANNLAPVLNPEYYRQLMINIAIVDISDIAIE